MQRPNLHTANPLKLRELKTKLSEELKLVDTYKSAQSYEEAEAKIKELLSTYKNNNWARCEIYLAQANLLNKQLKYSLAEDLVKKEIIDYLSINPGIHGADFYKTEALLTIAHSNFCRGRDEEQKAALTAIVPQFQTLPQVIKSWIKYYEIVEDYDSVLEKLKVLEARPKKDTEEEQKNKLYIMERRHKVQFLRFKDKIDAEKNLNLEQALKELPSLDEIIIYIQNDKNVNFIDKAKYLKLLVKNVFKILPTYYSEKQVRILASIINQSFLLLMKQDEGKTVKSAYALWKALHGDREEALAVYKDLLKKNPTSWSTYTEYFYILNHFCGAYEEVTKKGQNLYAKIQQVGEDQISEQWQAKFHLTMAYSYQQLANYQKEEFHLQKAEKHAENIKNDKKRNSTLAPIRSQLAKRNPDLKERNEAYQGTNRLDEKRSARRHPINPLIFSKLSVVMGDEITTTKETTQSPNIQDEKKFPSLSGSSSKSEGPSSSSKPEGESYLNIIKRPKNSKKPKVITTTTTVATTTTTTLPTTSTTLMTTTTSETSKGKEKSKNDKYWKEYEDVKFAGNSSSSLSFVNDLKKANEEKRSSNSSNSSSHSPEVVDDWEMLDDNKFEFKLN